MYEPTTEDFASYAKVVQYLDELRDRCKTEKRTIDTPHALAKYGTRRGSLSIKASALTPATIERLPKSAVTDNRDKVTPTVTLTIKV